MINVRNVTFSYKQERVFDLVNFSAVKGEIHGILGRPGSGKTTLFNLLYNIIKPETGEITYNGESLHDGLISFLEKENYLYPYMRGKEYIQLMAGSNSSIDQWNELFEIPLEECIEFYNAGTRKKLALMTALLLDRPIIILDEPFKDISTETAYQISHILQTIKTSKVIIIGSNIMNDLTRCCDKISVISNEKMEKTYEKSQYIDTPQITTNSNALFLPV